MGGLGVMLTSLSIAQANSPLLDISVILPHYSFLRDGDHRHQATKFAHITVPITSTRGRVRFVGCHVSLMQWRYTPITDFLGANTSIAAADAVQKTIDVFLIGPGDEAPFRVAFKAKDAGDVYSAYRPLKQEWKDLWFAQATARFIEYVNEPQATRPTADVVHLHGATNAMVAYYLRSASKLTHHRPAIVYTLHDSLDEVEYSNLVSNAVTFLPPSGSEAPPYQPLESYILGSQVFPSSLGIDLADMVTFVSRSIARDIVEGRFRFSMQDLVMPSVSRRASEGAFIGVTNGLDYTDQHKNPFIAPELVNSGVSFPRIGRGVSSTLHQDFSDATEQAARPSFSAIKSKAKRLLVRRLPHLFSEADLDRPLMLFIGRFQYNKGCEFFEPVLELIFKPGAVSTNARLVVMGARNNYPIAALRSLVTQYPDHMTLIDDTTSVQQEFGTLIRMASDYAFVPSFSEAFGLVAAEGLLFGMQVISSGVGGLKEFLRTGDGPIADESRVANAIVFNLYSVSATKADDKDAHNVPGELDLALRADHARPGVEALRPAFERCRNAVELAITTWHLRRVSPDRQENFVRTMVSDALELEWSRRGGPVDEVSADERDRILVGTVTPGRHCSWLAGSNGYTKPTSTR